MDRRLIPILLLAAVRCAAQLPNETERLMATARLWVTIEYFHPYLVTHDVDWDAALVAALPDIRSAGNTAELRAALSGMLEGLHDPETHLLPSPSLPDPATGPQLSLVRTANSVNYLLKPQASAETLQLDIAGIPVVVRLSEPAVTLPGIHAHALPASDPYPDTGLRLLAAFKVWGAIHYFFAYKDLMDEDWDDVFAGYLGKFIQARDAVDYNLALADLLTHLTDTNTAPQSKTLDAYFGEAPVGLDIRLLDKYPIVNAVLDPAATAAGVRPGDVLKRIGNESTTDRFRRLVQYVPASTPQRSGYDAIQKITSGPAGTEVELLIENAKGEAHPVKLTRAFRPLAPQRSTEPVAVLPGNIGYLDLDRLPVSGAEAALQELGHTKAIILDLRGRAPAAQVIARHLTTQANVAEALVNTPVALRPDIASAGIAIHTATTFEVRTLPSPLQPVYTGKTVALIDERTIGESEYAGIMFQAANKTEFIGAPTAGAESRIEELRLPGGITLRYSAQDIRMGNGGKLQRLGLQPNLPAATTAQGLRAGRDEVLDAALAHLAQ